jgi:hypothetical protein
MSFKLEIYAECSQVSQVKLKRLSKFMVVLLYSLNTVKNPISGNKKQTVKATLRLNSVKLLEVH